MLADVSIAYHALKADIEQEQYLQANEHLQQLQNMFKNLFEDNDGQTQLSEQDIVFLKEIQDFISKNAEQLTLQQQKVTDELKQISHTRSHLIAKKYSI